MLNEEENTTNQDDVGELIINTLSNPGFAISQHSWSIFGRALSPAEKATLLSSIVTERDYLELINFLDRINSGEFEEDEGSDDSEVEDGILGHTAEDVPG